MSKEIDERVVSMQFDNALFEKNIQKSLKSIDDLNKSLNNLDGAKGLEEVSKAAKEVDMTPIVTSAKNVEKSFSTMEIVGITAISRLTNSLITFGSNLGRNFWNSTIGQIKAGGWKRASDIKAGKFMLEGLGLGDRNVELLSEAAQKAVKGTAAGLGEAMKAAGVMATSGLKDAEKMETTLRGIAGVSAMTGRSFENIANIYSTVASNGKLMTMQLRQFSFAGINAAAVLAKQLGKTEAEINDMVTKGKIDFETFSDAMSDAFGKHAEDANKTFEGSMANMKAALSRIGEKFATPFMDNAKDVFNVLRVFFDSVKDAMAPIHDDFANLMKIGNMFVHKVFSPFVEKVKDAEGNTKWIAKENKILENIVAGVRNLYSIVVLIFKTFADAFRDVFPPLSDTTETFKEFTGSLMPTNEGLKTLKFAFKVILIVIKQVTDTLGTLLNIGAKALSVIFAIANKLLGTFGFLDETTGDLFESLKNFKLVEKIMDGIGIAVVMVGSAIAGVISLIGKLINKLKEFVSFDVIKNIGINIINGIVNGLKIGFDLLKKVWTSIINFIPESIKKALKISSPSKIMKTIGGFIMAGLVAGLIAGKDNVSKVLNGLGEMFGSLISYAIDFASLIGSVLTKAFNKLTDSVKSFNKTTNEDNIKSMEKNLETVGESARGAVHGYDNGTAYGIEKITVVQTAAKETFTKNNEAMAASQEDLSTTMDKTVPSIGDRLMEFVATLDATKVSIILLGSIIIGVLSKGTTPLGSFMSKFTIFIAGIVGALYLLNKLNVGELLNNVGSAFENFFSRISKSAEENKDTNKVANFFNNIVNFFKEFRENMLAVAGKAIAMSFAIAVIGLIINITKLAGYLVKGLKQLVSAIQNLGNITVGFKETFTDKMVKISLAIAVIALAVAELGKVVESSGGPQNLRDAVNILVAVMAAFAVLTGVVAAADKFTGSSFQALNNVTKIILSFTLMCLSLIGLGIMISKINFTDDVLFAIGLVGAALFAFLSMLQKITLGGGMNINVTIKTIFGLAVVITALGAVITAMVLAMSKLGNWGNMLTASLGIAMIIGTLMSSLALIINQLRTTEEWKGLNVTKSLVPENVAILSSLGVFLLALGGFIKILSTIPSNSIGPMFVGWITAMLSLIAIGVFLNRTKDSFKTLVQNINDIASALVKLGIAMYIIGNMDQNVFDLAYNRMMGIIGDLEAIIIAVGIIRSLYTVIFKVILNLFDKDLSKSFKMDKSNDLAETVWGFAIALASLAAALAIMAGIFALMPKDRLDEFKEWTLSVITLLGCFGLLMSWINKSSGEDDKKKTINKIWGIAAVMASISGLLISMMILSIVPADDLIVPLMSIGILLLAMGQVFKSLGETSKYVKQAKGSLILIGIVAGLFTALTIFASFKEGAATAALSVAFSLLLVMGAIALVIKSLSNDVKVDDSVIGSILLLSIVAGIFMGVIASLAGANRVNEALSVAVGLAAIMLSLAGAIVLISGVTLDKSVMFGLVAAGAALVAIAAALVLLKDADPATVLAIAGAISLVMISMALFVGALGLINSILPIASAALIAFGQAFIQIGTAVLVGGLGAAAVILALGYSIGKIADAVERMQGLELAKIAGGITAIAGSIVLLGLAFAAASVATAAGIIIIGAALSKLVFMAGPAMMAIGVFMMAGLAKGISSGEKNPIKAILKGCRDILAAACDALGIASPSKKFKEIGDFIMQGLGTGIVQKIPFVGKILENALNSLVEKCYKYSEKFEEVGDDWSKLPEVLLGDKLDMSNLTGGVASITDMFDELGFNMDEFTDAAGDAGDAAEDFGLSAEEASVGSDKLKDSIASTLDMFTEFNDQAYLSSKDVIPAFMSQLEGVAKWRDELASLSARGLGEVIIQELENMGPQAYEKVHALYTMTNSELAMMNIMYKQKLALQNGSRKKIEKSFKKLGDGITEEMEESMDEMSDGIVDSMSDLGSNMMAALKKQIDYEKVVNQVTGFRNNVADKIRSSMSIFEAVGEQEKVKAEDLLKNMKEQVKHVGQWSSMIVEMAAKGFDEGLVATLTEMGPQSYSKVQAFLTMNEQQIAEANRLFEASERVPEYGADKIVKAFAQAGFTASMGLTDSFLEGLDPEAVEQAMSDLGQRSITSLQEEIANKPYELGEIIPSDFADGLVAAAEAETERVKTAMKDLADAANIENYLEDKSLPQEPLKTVRSPEREAQAAAEMEAIRKSQHNYDKIYREQQTKADKIRLSRENKDEDYISEHPIQDEQIAENYAEKYDAYLQSAIDKVNEYYTQNKIKIDLNQFMQLEFTDDGNVWKYNIKELNKNGLLTHLIDLSGSDAEAKAMVDYVKNISAYATDEEGFYTAGSTNTKGFAKGTADSSALKDAEESGVKVKDTTINGLAGGGGGHYAVNAIDKTPLAMAAKNVALGATLAFADSIESDESLDATNTAAQNLAGSFIISLRDNLASLMDAILNSDNTTAPKIKPVFDGSNVIDGFKSLFNKNIDLSTSATIDVSTKTRDKSVVDAINGISNKEVVEAVNDLASMVDNLRMQATRLQVVMDTGQLVGVLTPGIDQSLGMNAINAGRWVI